MKTFLIAFIFLFVIFGCKHMGTHDGILRHKNDLPFDVIGSPWLTDIFLELSDVKGKYYNIKPMDKYYQDFINNMGHKVRVRGEECYDGYYINFVIEEGVNIVIINNRLLNAKIRKVLD